ncbi:MAG: hypothetical protein WBZ29_15985 [Methanocella sp.]
MASRLVSVVIAGIGGGLLIGCTFPVIYTLADFFDFVLSRRSEVSPTITPASDHGWILFMFFLLWVFTLVPVFLAVTGALSVKLSRRHIPDIKSRVPISYAAGLTAIVSGVIIYDYLTRGIFMGPSIVDWFTSPSPIIIMLLSALISSAGGVFYWRATKHTPAK